MANGDLASGDLMNGWIADRRNRILKGVRLFDSIRLNSIPVSYVVSAVYTCTAPHRIVSYSFGLVRFRLGIVTTTMVVR